MSSKKLPKIANISAIYAISLTPDKKRHLMGRIYKDVSQRNELSEENVRSTCQYLNQCYEPDLNSILLAMEIVVNLLSRRVAESEVIQSYRKQLSYVSSVLEADNCGKIATYFTRIASLALQSDNISADSFPISILKCILILMHRLQVTGSSDRTIILGALRSTLQWAKRKPSVYQQCGFGTLIRSAISSTSHLQNDLTAVTELATLCRLLLDVFYNTQPNPTLHPVEILLRSAYEKIFTRLVSEWTDTTCYELLLYVLFDVLKRDIYTHLKLDIVRTLGDAAGGGIRRLVRLLSIPRHLREPDLLQKLHTVLTIALTHSLFRYEPTARLPHFRSFLKTVEQMVTAVDYGELAGAKFLCLKLPRASLTLECVCFVFVLRHLDLLEGFTSSSLELDYVYNLVASVNIIYYKRWKLPSFLVKHFIEGLSRFSNSAIFKTNMSIPESEMKTFLLSSSYTVRAGGNAVVTNLFGRLPPTVQRIQWIQMQPEHFQTKFIFHQQLDILQECYVMTGDDGLVHSLLGIFREDTLLEVLKSRQASPMARRNASVLLSKCTLTGTMLTKVLQQIKRLKRQTDPKVQFGTVCNWVRAVCGSVQQLNDGSKRMLWAALTSLNQATNGCINEASFLLFSTRAQLLESMMLGKTGTTVQMQLLSNRQPKQRCGGTHTQ